MIEFLGFSESLTIFNHDPPMEFTGQLLGKSFQSERDSNWLERYCNAKERQLRMK